MTLGTLGLTSLLLTVGGYWAGRFGEATSSHQNQRARILIAVTVLTIGVEIGSLVVHVFLGDAASFGTVVGRVLLPRWPSTWRSRFRRTGPAQALPTGASPQAGAGKCPEWSPRAGASSRATHGSRSYRSTPRAAARIAILGVVAVVLFAPLLPALGAPGHLRRSVPRDGQGQPDPHVPHPAAARPDRGQKRRRVVSNVPGTIVQLWPAYTDGRLDQVIVSSRKLLDVPARDIRRQVRALRDDPLTPVVVKTYVHDDKASYIREHQNDFPGVEVAPTQLRRYEQGLLASHVLGYVGEVDARGSRPARRGVRGRRQDRQGRDRAGLRHLPARRARDRAGRVNLLNEVTSAPSPSQFSTPGYAALPTIDARDQRAAEEAIRPGSGSLAKGATGPRTAGPSWPWIRSTVRYALASNPTYDPSVFAGVPSQEKYDRVFGRSAQALNFPALNRAIAGEYRRAPPSSRSRRPLRSPTT